MRLQSGCTTYLAPEYMGNPHARIVNHTSEVVCRVSIALDQDEVVKLLVPVIKVPWASETFSLNSFGIGCFGRK